ncbi:hypothetical protein ACFQH6_11110 [Halobacteriaceae archaeon GCM10025711]
MGSKLLTAVKYVLVLVLLGSVLEWASNEGYLSLPARPGGCVLLDE